MKRVTDKQDVVLYAAVNLLTANFAPRAVLEVMADVLAERIHDSSPELVDSMVSADELNHRIKQRLQAMALEGGTE